MVQYRCNEKKSYHKSPITHYHNHETKGFEVASIYKRKESKGWRAVVHIKGYPTVCNHFDRKQE